MTRIGPIHTLVRELMPGDRIDLEEVAQDVTDMRWLTRPWEGRRGDRDRASTHYAAVRRVRLAASGAVVDFENFAPWYLPASLSVNIYAPK